MYHYNGKSWVRLAPSAASTSVTTNFHGISNVPATSNESPVSSSKYDQDSKDEIKTVRRAPLKQLFPRTPTPFKKAYAEAVKKGGSVEQLDLEKSPELFEDLQEIILQDVILPPRSKKIRRSCPRPLEDGPTTSFAFMDAHHRALEGDSILDITSTPSKILNGSNFLLSPPFAAAVSVASTASRSEVIEPKAPPNPYSPEWFRIVCGRTPAQVDLTYMAKELLQRRSSAATL